MQNTERVKVVHLSTVHMATDVRIFFRECQTLAKSGFDVTLVARAVEPGDKDGVRILPLASRGSRVARLLLGQLEALRRLRPLRFDVLHFHDPELVLVGLWYAWRGKRVIFDIHENIREALWDKRWIPLKKLTIPAFLRLEALALRWFRVVLAETSYERLYPDVPEPRRRTIRNFPDYAFFKPFQSLDRGVGIRLFYVGGVTIERGALVTLRALRRLKEANQVFSFDCIGPIDAALQAHPEFQQLAERLKPEVVFHGRLPLNKAYEIGRRATLGLCVLQPVKNYVGSYPTKVFEYMAVGLPFLISDFPLYRQVLAPHGVGVFIDPADDARLAEQIVALANDPQRLKAMAAAGVAAVDREFSWRREGDKLCAFYRAILGATPAEAGS